MSKATKVHGSLYATGPAARAAACSESTIQRFANENRIEHLRAEGNRIIVTSRGVQQAREILAKNR